MPGGPELAERLDGWTAANLQRLAALEAGWADAARGETLLHADLRADNLLLAQDGRVTVVDWPYAVTGAPWVDGLLFLPSVGATGNIDIEQVWRGFGPARDADSEAGQRGARGRWPGIFWFSRCSLLRRTCRPCALISCAGRGTGC